DHLVQNSDPAKPHYGVPSQHPELVAPALSDNGKVPAFWNHMNSVAYNAALDQVVMSVRGNSELWVIDHSTTTAQAAGHTGGRSGKGGDLLYRWGNPATYGIGSTGAQMLYQQHDVQWIDAGSPGEGHFLVFNNGLNRPGGASSSVDEITPPVNADGSYTRTAGAAFGPTQLTWTYGGTFGKEYYAEAISGAQRLPNGNTLICYGTHGVLVEVTPAGEAVWEYINPVTNEGPQVQGSTAPLDVRGHDYNAVFKVRRYAPTYAGLAGRDLSAGAVIEK
ncbi:MAG: arylsulfotransferase (ASST), partial [Gemmatimonadetes bacterium]|nr:arylsulfotransferase (ASST) [Gemmatimonadota bacterium]